MMNMIDMLDVHPWCKIGAAPWVALVAGGLPFEPCCVRGLKRHEWADNSMLVGWLRAEDLGHLVCAPGGDDLTQDDLWTWAWSNSDYHPWGLMKIRGWSSLEGVSTLDGAKCKTCVS